MRWYDIFSLFYDPALEATYAPFRGAAVDAMALSAGDTVLDLPCGTGQSLPLLVDAVGPTGTVLGADVSSGMVKRAQKRVTREGWDTVHLHTASVHDVDPSWLQAHAGVDGVDAVLCALGLTAFPDWKKALDTLIAVLRPGGRLVVFDVFAHDRTFQTRSVEVVAQADLSRRVWEAMQARLGAVERTALPADPKVFGGELYVAVGTR